jgi:molybdopterin/thiamine biosynthesis adenylyltransferase
VRVVIAETALNTPAGRALTLTLARLLPRLCERISFVGPTAPCPSHLRPLLNADEFSPETLACLAELIWDGEFDTDSASAAEITVCVGGPGGDVGVGVDRNGNAVATCRGTVRIDQPDAVFAAIVAAALACTQVASLVYPGIFRGRAVPEARLAEGPFGGPLEPGAAVSLARPVLGGVGAVGCALIYALIVARAEGSVVLLDPDTVSDTNLMRYILFDSRHLQLAKTNAAKEIVAATGLDLKVETSETVVSEFLRAHPDERERLTLLISAVDTYDARRELAGELARTVVNAGTAPSDFTISRHGFGDGFACLACLYPRDATDTDPDAVTARELGLTKDEVSEMRRTRSPLTPNHLKAIARHRGEPDDRHLAYEGEPLDSFYHRVICGTTSVETPYGEAVAPLAQGSALAGFLLARALADAGGSHRRFRMDFIAGPIPELQQRSNPTARRWCRYCGRAALLTTYQERWGDCATHTSGAPLAG